MFVQRTNLNGGIHKGLWLNDPEKTCKVWKSFSWDRGRSIANKILNFTSLSRVLSQKVWHTHTRIYMPPLTRNITRRASRVHFTVYEERLLAVLKWKEIFLFSAQVKLKTMNNFIMLSVEHGERQCPTLGCVLYINKTHIDIPHLSWFSVHSSAV